MQENKEVLEETEVESEVESTKGHEVNPQEGNNIETKDIIESKEHHITKLKKKRLIPKVV